MLKFDNVKVGDRVFSIQYGLGTIDRFGTVNDHKVFKVDFDNGDYEWYFKDGRVNIDDVNPTLFWNGFRIPTEEEDKKPFDLVEFLRENLKPKEFVCGEYNYYYFFWAKDEEWSVCYDAINQDIKVYFEDSNYYFIDILNKNKITPQQLRNAYRELGWL